MPVESDNPLDAAVSRLRQRLDQTIREIAGPEGLAAVDLSANWLRRFTPAAPRRSSN